MGRLIFDTDFESTRGINGTSIPPNLPASWYVEDVSYSSLSGTKNEYRSSFPYCVVMDRSTIHRPQYFSSPHNHSEKIKIRRWIERSIPSTVLYRDISYEYNAVWNPEEPSWQQKSYRVMHGYSGFMFEEESEATFFALTFAEMVCRSFSIKAPDDDNYPHYRNDAARFVNALNDAFGIDLSEEMEKVYGNSAN